LTTASAASITQSVSKDADWLIPSARRKISHDTQLKSKQKKAKCTMKLSSFIFSTYCGLWYLL